jgi:hypothetical protein
MYIYLNKEINLRIFFSLFPVTTASSEKSFSKLKIININTTIGQERLTSIFYEIRNNLMYRTQIWYKNFVWRNDEFVSLKERKVKFLYLKLHINSN